MPNDQDALSVRRSLTVQRTDEVLIIAGRPGLPFSVALRLVIFAGVSVAVFYTEGAIRTVLALGGLFGIVTTILLLRSTAVITTLTLTRETARLSRRGVLSRQELTAPLAHFRIEGISDLYSKGGEVDQLPVHYLDCALAGSSEKLFLAHPVADLEWIRTEVARWRDAADRASPT